VVEAFTRGLKMAGVADVNKTGWISGIPHKQPAAVLLMKIFSGVETDEHLGNDAGGVPDKGIPWWWTVLAHRWNSSCKHC
jgi:hypothetical protein